MHRTARRAALCPLSGIHVARPPRKGWRREDPGAGDGDGGSGHDPNAGGNNTDDTDADKGGDQADKKPKINGDFDPERAAADLGKARAGEKAAKQAAKEAQARVDAILKAAGLTPDGKTDPETQLKELGERATAAEARANALATREAVRSGAMAHNADPELLLDSSGFLKQLAELDPAADDFDDKVAAAVKAHVKAHPRFAATGGKGAGKQGGDHTGGGTNNEGRPKSIREALARKHQQQ